MKQVLLYTIVALCFLSCRDDDDILPTDCIIDPLVECNCPLTYNPVCGCNGQTYPNSCVAECHGVVKYKVGECQ